MWADLLKKIPGWQRPEPPVYDLRTIRAPRLAGRALKLMAVLLELPGFRGWLRPVLLAQVGLRAFRKYRPNAGLTPLPLHSPEPPVLLLPSCSLTEYETALLQAENRKPKTENGFQPESALDFHRAYLAGETTPLKVAQRLLDVIRNLEASAVPLRPLIEWDGENLLRQAQESMERYQQGRPAGLLDGVPVAIKDEFDLVPYPTRVGTQVLGTNVATRDATAVSRLRKAGALLFGKANMHELGMGVTGFNPHHGSARNPYDPERYPGGSSSGPAVAVAVGLCPVALGADGGGSIRIPAALCGISGLKATWSRVSSAGQFPLAWSIGHAGPLAATLSDLTLAYGVLAGADENDPWTQRQPEVNLPNPESKLPDGLRIGVFVPWFEHAKPEVFRVCLDAVETLQKLGLERKAVEFRGLEAARLAHLVAIASEMLSANAPHFRRKSRFGRDIRINLSLAEHLSATDYVKAQRVRTELMAALSKVFEEVDILITPTTARTAPPILPDVTTAGESDLTVQDELMRFVVPFNLTGHPALSVPCGYDPQGLPVGLQLVGRPWEEALLLRVGAALEAKVARTSPMLHHTLLSG
ncbi:MAG: amidase [SAR324 cluster bacterium]|nr:amidase [SAR324 cluster bacterium]MEC7418007.1 amidase [SAR324 cluster bacterium]